MQDFEFRVYDFRHAAPSVMLVLTRDERSARNMAERTLRADEGCSHIEVWVAQHHLFTVEAPAALEGQAASRKSTPGPSVLLERVPQERTPALRKKRLTV